MSNDIYVKILEDNANGSIYRAGAFIPAVVIKDTAITADGMQFHLYDNPEVGETYTIHTRNTDMSYINPKHNPMLTPIHEHAESDPNGLSLHSPGAKADDGKVRVDLVLGGFSRALYAICANGTLGAIKYTANGWEDVLDGQNRYADAKGRHTLKKAIGRNTDDQFDLPELAMAAWNSLAELELALREQYPDPDEFIEAFDQLVKNKAKELQSK